MPDQTTKSAEPNDMLGLSRGFMEKLGDFSPTPEPPKPDANGPTGQPGSPANGNPAATPDPNPQTQPPKTDAKTEPKIDPKPADKTPVATADPKPEVKPTEPTKPETDDEKWPRTAIDWKNAKAKAREREDGLRKEIEKLTGQVKELSVQKPVEPPKPSPEFELTKAEVEKLRKENEEYSKRLQLVDVTKHPKFEAHFNNKLAAQVDLAKRIVGDEKAAEIEQILRLPDGPYRNEKMEGFLQDLGPLQNSRLGGVLNNLESIEAERQQAIAQAQAEREKYNAEQTAQSEQRKKQSEEVWKNVITEFQDAEKGLAVYQVREGDSEWNNRILDQINTAKRLVFERNDPAVIAKSALHAAAFPAILQYAKAREAAHQAAIAEKDKELAGLKDQIGKLSAVMPTAKNGTDPTTLPEQPKISQLATDPHSALKLWTQRMAGARDE